MAYDFQFGGVDITTVRNYFGRQRQSFEQELEIHDQDLQNVGGATQKPFNGIFIRAPGIASIDQPEKVTVWQRVQQNASEFEVDKF